VGNSLSGSLKLPSLKLIGTNRSIPLETISEDAIRASRKDFLPMSVSGPVGENLRIAMGIPIK
jgi:hypothetical protein